MLGVAMYTTIKTLWERTKNKTEIAKGQSKRKIRKDLNIHGQTINKYIQECIFLGIDPLNCDPSQISQELCSVISKT